MIETMPVAKAAQASDKMMSGDALSNGVDGRGMKVMVAS
jgi:hypothetical protein